MERYHGENWYTLSSVDSLKRVDVIKHPPMRCNAEMLHRDARCVVSHELKIDRLANSHGALLS